MKSLSPWFQTANLLNGIRKTVSEIEASRTTNPAEDRRDSSRESSRPLALPQSRT